MTKPQAILASKCPRCRKGNIFTHSALHLTKFAKTNQHCPHCGLRFEREPGFFDGAMYISYAFSVAIVVVFGIGTYQISNRFYQYDPDTWVYLTVIFSAVVLLFRFTFRYSRTLMLYGFGSIKYDQRFKI
ncbi:MAG: DUF983 domain-containing protein, partial [Bacteroidota bacterium]